MSVDALSALATALGGFRANVCIAALAGDDVVSSAYGHIESSEGTNIYRFKPGQEDAWREYHEMLGEVADLEVDDDSEGSAFERVDSPGPADGGDGGAANENTEGANESNEGANENNDENSTPDDNSPELDDDDVESEGGADRPGQFTMVVHMNEGVCAAAMYGRDGEPEVELDHSIYPRCIVEACELGPLFDSLISSLEGWLAAVRKHAGEAVPAAAEGADRQTVNIPGVDGDVHEFLLTDVPETEVSGEVHEGLGCDICYTAPLKGVRYHCTTCEDYDLCARCHDNKGHDHEMVPVDPPANEACAAVHIRCVGDGRPVAFGCTSESSPWMTLVIDFKDVELL